MNPFSAWIKQVGLTTRAVAQALGIGDPAVSKIRKDGYWPRRDIALRIYRFTGGAVTPTDMLGDNGAAEKSREHKLALRAIDKVAKQREETLRAKRKKRRKPRTEARRIEQRPE